MLCGQGGSGKSTYANMLIKQLAGNNIIISMDQIKNLYFNKTIEEFNLLYVENIQNAINNNYDYIICDYAQDSYDMRRWILKQLTFPIPIDFIAIAIRPTYEKIIERIEKYKILLQKEKEKIKKIYEDFQMPYAAEFMQYNFNSIKIYEYNNI